MESKVEKINPLKLDWNKGPLSRLISRRIVFQDRLRLSYGKPGKSVDQGHVYCVLRTYVHPSPFWAASKQQSAVGRAVEKCCPNLSEQP